MTALAGVWSTRACLKPKPACERMLIAQRMYGLDPHVVWTSDEIALGSRLYPLLAEDGRGTSTVEGGSGVVVVGDIRIDNRAHLIEALNISPSRAACLSDTAFFATAWERWSETALRKIVGDFAVAVWEPRNRRLVLARDFASQRPLHYYQGPGLFAFSSMPKGLHTLEEIPRSPNLDKIVAHLALLGEDDDRSFFESISKVRAGHFVVVTADGVSSHRHWFPDVSPLRFPRARDYEEGLTEKLDRAVAARLRGTNGVVGTHLSAGLDSSSVTASAATQMLPHGRLTAFTSVPGPGFESEFGARELVNEGPIAADTASMYSNVEHVLVPSGSSSPISALERHFHLYELPVLNPINMLWLDEIKREAAERKIRVLLTGARGNMSLSYSGFSLLSDLLTRGSILELLRVSFEMKGAGHSWRKVAANVILPLVPDKVATVIGALRGRKDYIRNYSLMNENALDKLKSADGRSGLQGDPRESRSAMLKMTMLSGADYGNYNKGTLAFWGLDTRDPTSDRELVEFSLRIPDEQCLRHGTPKALIKSAMAGRLPKSLIEEPRKGRQAADWYEQFPAYLEEASSELMRLESYEQTRQWLDIEKARGVLDGWREDKARIPETAIQYRIGLMRALAAGAFVRKTMGGNQ